MVSIDGFFEGENGELDWHVADKEYKKFAVEILRGADALLFGKVTYEHMEEYWNSPSALKEDPVIAE
ncbi:dihydrofolate reductase family protein [Cytobacillus purgationiresistens]|uniref:Dihydrofolate reductase n=1 Tax=Cytobacillus purgationiresistens TaxID=863449 RepID=A0ABU0ANV4_9BACI|nr:hypothetical protein [Cytobacillus purgationiresistens]MDQ0272539.1 dihydrofolate reductase [Cytobacillus purgationiresistens]